MRRGNRTGAHRVAPRVLDSYLQSLLPPERTSAATCLRCARPRRACHARGRPARAGFARPHKKQGLKEPGVTPAAE